MKNNVSEFANPYTASGLTRSNYAQNVAHVPGWCRENAATATVDEDGEKAVEAMPTGVPCSSYVTYVEEVPFV